MALKAIWPGVEIPVLGVTGKYSSGKSLFIATIDPKHSIMFDFEKSLNSYKGFGFEHVDFPSECLATYGSGYTSVQAFQLFYNKIQAIEAGRYSVIGVDPVSDIESGMVEWVKGRYREFGFSSPEKFAATGGIFWEAVRSEWKRFLAGLTSKCQTFAFTTHLKVVWKHGRPTDALEPKGKSTLMELASLSLFLERNKDQEVPSANVLKTRVAITRFNEELGEPQLVGVLPPRLDRATPKRIREYILNPPDFADLKEYEKEQVKELSEADKLEMQLQIAANQRAASEAELEAAKLDVRARAQAFGTPTPAADAPADKGSSSGSSEDPKAIRIEQIFANHSDDSLKTIGRKVYTILHGRGFDVSGFTSADKARQYAANLTEDEILSLTS